MSSHKQFVYQPLLCIPHILYHAAKLVIFDKYQRTIHISMSAGMTRATMMTMITRMLTVSGTETATV